MKQSYSKNELCQMSGVSRNTFGNWLRRMCHSIPDYKPKQRVLTPKQARFIADHLGIDL